MRAASTPTHILGLLLAAAAYSCSAHDFTAGAAHGASGVPVRRHERHEEVMRGVSHEDLMAQVQLAGTGLLHSLEYYAPKFIGWAFEYGMWFNSLEEGVHALENFARADDKIALHNSEEEGYTLGHNAYSHMSWEEFRDHFSIGKGMVVPPSSPYYSVHEPDFNFRVKGEKATARRLRALPEEVDWTTKGGVTYVKNQGSCGSCWSFSTTGAMEGALFVKTGELKVLSEQELVDCDTYDSGCDGGLMDYSFHWIQQHHGICSEEDYPYTAEGGFCMECDVVPGTDVAKWIDVDTTEEALMEAVAQQPVSIAIEADQMSFQLYSGGVLTASCGTNLDHGVLLVGYGVSEDGIKYWKVKNSWGADWGMNGYILLGREEPQKGGECGILMQASYPVLV